MIAVPSRTEVTRAQRLFCALIALLTTVVVLIPGVNPASAAAVADIRGDADWILTAQLSSGAIANYVDRQAVWPYLSNFAAMGLARATQVTGDKKYVNAAWQWLSWYQAHMDANGFVTDYTISNGIAMSTGSMDSTDSYAGTFLIALRDAYATTKDTTRLTTFRTGIALAVKAIESTQNSDGLTWAKPTWLVKYLMDQGETYAGLLAAYGLAKTVKDSTTSSRASSDATRMRNGVAALWNSVTTSYDWAVQTDGAHIVNDWSMFYSDSLEQAWAVAFGLVDSPRQADLMRRFVSAQANWALPTATALFRGAGTQPVGYWPIPGLGLYRVGNSLAGPAVGTIRSAALVTGRAWPFTTGIAGQLILFEGFTLAGAQTFDTKLPAPAPAASSTPAPTPAPVTPAPTARATPAPSPSPTPTPTPTPSPTPSPTPTPLLPVATPSAPAVSSAPMTSLPMTPPPPP